MPLSSTGKVLTCRVASLEAAPTPCPILSGCLKRRKASSLLHPLAPISYFLTPSFPPTSPPSPTTTLRALHPPPSPPPSPPSQALLWLVDPVSALLSEGEEGRPHDDNCSFLLPL
eukprot:5905663-Pleurochrysis_carterae.AAC.1